MASDRLTVGLPVSQTGQFSRHGKHVLAGVERWVRWVNHRGGITLDTSRRLPIELRQYDDESSATVTKHQTRRLIQDDEVDILFGPYSSRLTLAAAPIAEAHEMVLWNHSGATDALYDRGFSWLVSNLAPASRYFHGVLDLLQQLGRPSSEVAICWSESGSFGTAVASGAAAHARASGYSVVTERTWEPPLDSAASLVDSVVDETPDLVLAVGSFDDDVRVARALTSRETPTTALGVVAAGVSAFGEQLGERANGVVGPSQWELDPDYYPDYGPSPATVIAGNDHIEYPTAQAFAMGLIIEHCIAAGGAYDPVSATVDQRQMRQAAKTADVTTFYGRFRIDPETGKQIGHTPVVVQWQTGEKRVVWPKNRRVSEPLPPITDPGCQS